MKTSHPFRAQTLRVLYTRGNNFQIGQQHGEALKEVLSEGMSRFYREFWQRMMKTKNEGFVTGILLELGKLFIDPVLVGRLKRNIPEDYKERFRGMARSSKYTEEELLDTLILPDLMPMLQAYLGTVRPSALIEASHPPRFGCTSFFAKDRYFYQGRNLDFPGVSYWDRFPVIQVFELPGKIKYLSFASAGVPIAGITGINEAQIMVALHQHYSRATSLKGKLPFVIAERILAEAVTLEDAKAILDEEPVASSWAFVISDGKKGEGFLQECDPESRGTLFYSDPEEILTHANCFQTKECQKREYATTARMNWDNFSRKQRLHELLAKEGGVYTPERLVKAISDHYDPFWQEEKIINRTVSQVYNIQSLVVNLTEMKAYVAEGDSPIHIRNYHEFDLGKIFSGQEGRTGRSFEGYRFSKSKMESAKTDYILSFVSAFDGDYEKAQEKIDASLESEFTPEAALVCSILSMKKGQYTKSVELLSKAKSFIEEKKRRKGLLLFPPEYFEICLFLGRALDLLNRRQEALIEYRTLCSHSDLEDANVRRLALQKGPYTRKQLNRILMPYSTYIPFE